MKYLSLRLDCVRHGIKIIYYESRAHSIFCNASVLDTHLPINSKKKKLMVFRLVKKVSAFYGTLKTPNRTDQSQSLPRPHQSRQLPPTLFFVHRLNITLPATPRSSIWLFPQISSLNPAFISSLPSPRKFHIPHPSNISLLD
jgi:hypothetical protein